MIYLIELNKSKIQRPLAIGADTFVFRHMVVWKGGSSKLLKSTADAVLANDRSASSRIASNSSVIYRPRKLRAPSKSWITSGQNGSAAASKILKKETTFRA